MLNEETKRFLNQFSKSEEWRKIREVLLWKLDVPCWLIDKDENYIIKVTQDRRYCSIMKANHVAYERCKEYYRSLQWEMDETKNYVVKACHAGFLGFQSPITVGGMMVAGIGASQLIDHDRPLNDYREYAKQLGIMDDEFISYINERESISRWLLETEVGLIFHLAQSSVNLVIKDNDIFERDILLRNLIEFYKLITEKRSMLLELEEKRLYEAIVEIAAKSIDAEICSLMMINKKTSLLEIKAAIGLDEEIIEKTSIRIGDDIAGYVAATGRPLLVKDVTKDERFCNLDNIGSPRYYTNSLISTPIKIGYEVIGVLNMNNETTRRIFNEKDLDLLSVIAEHASMVIEASRAYHDRIRMEMEAKKTQAERSEEIIAETRRIQSELENLKARLEEANRVKDRAEELSYEFARVEEMKAKIERLKEEASRTNEPNKQEQLRKEAARLTVEVDGIEEQDQKERLREEADRLRLEVERLRYEKEALRAEIEKAEGLILQVEEVEELREESQRLKDELEGMKKEEERLKAQIAEMEELRLRAEEAHQLRIQTEELGHLYELSKEIIQMEDPHHILDWLLGKIHPLFNYHVACYLLLEDNRLTGGIRHLYTLEADCIEDIKRRMVTSWSSLDPSGWFKREVNISVDEENLGDGKGMYRGKLQRLISSPLLDRGQTTGLLYVGSFDKDGFKENVDRRLLPVVANHASLAIEKARRYLETKELAERDELTGVYNFRYFGRFFSDEFKRAKRYNKQLSLIMLDFDYLKKFNDTYGHDEGNRLIKTVAHLIKENIREVDCLARFGGDEFAIALPETGSNAAYEMATRILDSLRNYEYKINDKVFSITASIGIASFPHIEAKTPKELFVRADEALYRAKRHGRNQAYVYKRE